MGKQDKNRKIKRHFDWSKKEAVIRQLVRDECFLLTSHVYDKIATNDWEYADVVESLLNGSISKAERDEIGDAIDNMKYTILGRDCWGNFLETVGKIVQDEDGRQYLVITAY